VYIIGCESACVSLFWMGLELLFTRVHLFGIHMFIYNTDYVCVICICIYIICIYICIHNLYDMYMHVYMYIRIYICLRIYMYTHVYMNMYIIYIYICVFGYGLQSYIRVHTCCKYIYITYIYIYNIDYI